MDDQLALSQGQLCDTNNCIENMTVWNMWLDNCVERLEREIWGVMDVDVLNTPIQREYMLVPLVPEVELEWLEDLENGMRTLVQVEEQLVHEVSLENWSQGDLAELEEWDRVHTIPNLSYVRNDSEGEEDIVQAIWVGVDLGEFSEIMAPWCYPYLTNPDITYPPD